MAALSVLIPAAGQSRRMGGQDKLLRPVDGVPQLRRTALFALSTGAKVLIALPPDAPDRRACLDGLDLTRLDVPDHASGMSASLRAAARAVPAGGALIILPADMPDITPEALNRLLRCHRDDPLAILAGAQGERRGHPVLLPADLVPALSELSGDVGARALLLHHANRLRPVPLAGNAALLDLDTVEDWLTWERARNPSTLRKGSVAERLIAAGTAVLAIVTGISLTGASGPAPHRLGEIIGPLPDGPATGSLTEGSLEAGLAHNAQTVKAEGRPIHLRYGAGGSLPNTRLPWDRTLDVTLFPAPSPQTLADIACLSLAHTAIALDFAPDGTSALRAGQPTGWIGERFILNLPPERP